MLKHTPGPWRFWNWQINAGSFENERKIAEINVTCGRGNEGEANARLIVSACNSYQKHCSDPVKCAEEDLLGEALEACRLAFIIIRDMSGEAENAIKEKLEQVLAKAKGEK